MRMIRWIALVGVFMAFGVSAPALAQRGIDVEQFRPALDGDGFIGIQGTTMPGPWQWNVGMWLNYSKQPLTARSGDERFDVIRHRLGGDFQFQIGLGTRVAIGLDLPLVLYQSGFAERVPGDGPAIAAQALGDPRITARVRLLGQDATSQRERRDGPGVALVASTALPLGDEDAYAGEGAASFDLQAVGDFRFFGIAAGLMLGWRHRFEQETIGGVVFRDQLLYGVGVNVPVPITPGLGARLEVRGAIDARFGGGPRNPVEGAVGFSYVSGSVTYLASVGTSFNSGVGSPTVRATAGLIWSPRSSDDDADLDGVPDDRDQCPHLPEDFDGFEDEDGCMDPDNDNDFVPDVDDRCPLEPSDEDRDADEDGCNDQ